MKSVHNLHNYQLKAVDFAIRKKRVALWLDMGLGKTLQTIAALLYAKDNKTDTAHQHNQPLQLDDKDK